MELQRRKTDLPANYCDYDAEREGGLLLWLGCGLIFWFVVGIVIIAEV